MDEITFALEGVGARVSHSSCFTYSLSLHCFFRFAFFSSPSLSLCPMLALSPLFAPLALQEKSSRLRTFVKCHKLPNVPSDYLLTCFASFTPPLNVTVMEHETIFFLPFSFLCLFFLFQQMIPFTLDSRLVVIYHCHLETFTCTLSFAHFTFSSLDLYALVWLIRQKSYVTCSLPLSWYQ